MKGLMRAFNKVEQVVLNIWRGMAGSKKMCLLLSNAEDTLGADSIANAPGDESRHWYKYIRVTYKTLCLTLLLWKI